MISNKEGGLYDSKIIKEDGTILKIEKLLKDYK
jgi:hypothetical protein